MPPKREISTRIAAACARNAAERWRNATAARRNASERFWGCAGYIIQKMTRTNTELTTSLIAFVAAEMARSSPKIGPERPPKSLPTIAIYYAIAEQLTP